MGGTVVLQQEVQVGDPRTFCVHILPMSVCEPISNSSNTLWVALAWW